MTRNERKIRSEFRPVEVRTRRVALTRSPPPSAAAFRRGLPRTIRQALVIARLA